VLLLELDVFGVSLLSLVFELDVELELELLILHPMTEAISNAKAIRQSCREFLFMGAPPNSLCENCAAYIDLGCACQRFSQ